MSGMPHHILTALTGPASRELLTTLAAARGFELTGVKVRQVDLRPGETSWASYQLGLRRDGATMSMTAGAAGAESGGLPRWPHALGTLTVGRYDGCDLAAWCFPFDPMLPGLAILDRPAELASHLAESGFALSGPLHTSVRAYRAGKRAVVQVKAHQGSCYVKALRPTQAALIARRHLILHGAGLPVPVCHSTTDSGLLTMPAIAGQSMRAQLLDGAGCPDGAALLALVQKMPTALCALPRRRSWSAGARHYANVIAAAMPEQADRVSHLANAVLAGISGYDEDQPCHGDLYEAQLLVNGSQITGLLDIDSAGPGRYADDLACLIAHLKVLGLIYPDRRQRLDLVAGQWFSVAAASLDPMELRARIAGVMLSLATGPHRVQEVRWRTQTLRRLNEVERWLERPAPGGG